MTRYPSYITHGAHRHNNYRSMQPVTAPMPSPLKCIPGIVHVYETPRRTRISHHSCVSSFAFQRQNRWQWYPLRFPDCFQNRGFGCYAFTEFCSLGWNFSWQGSQKIRAVIVLMPSFQRMLLSSIKKIQPTLYVCITYNIFIIYIMIWYIYVITTLIR